MNSKIAAPSFTWLDKLLKIVLNVFSKTGFLKHLDSNLYLAILGVPFRSTGAETEPVGDLSIHISIFNNKNSFERKAVTMADFPYRFCIYTT